jgi:kexin
MDVWEEQVQQYRRRYPRKAPTAAPKLSNAYDPEQWHLKNSGLATARVAAAWVAAGTMGEGQVVHVVDDGLEGRHQDLFPGYAPELSTSLHGNGRNPWPAYGNTHGSSVAGVCCARGYNGLPPHSPICGHGVAPGARVAGNDLIADRTTDAMEATGISFMAENVTVFSCSWGPIDDGMRAEAPQRLTRLALQHAARYGHGGKGCLTTWAAGNGRVRYDNCAWDGYAQNMYVLAIGAVTREGAAAPYSEACPALFISAPSSGGSAGITTVDVPATSGRMCRDDFGGTSSAAPFVAGVIALVAAANPALRNTDITTILAKTARPVDPYHPGWVVNGAGYKYNPQYGFGLVDAYGAVMLARTYKMNSTGPAASAHYVASRVFCYTSTNTLHPPQDTVVSTQTSAAMAHSGNRISLPYSIPNVAGQAAILWVDVASTNLVVERVEITVSITHSRRGELSFALESPAHTRLVIPPRVMDTSANLDSWTFAFVGMRGEWAAGRWSFIVADVVPGNQMYGSITDLDLLITGTKKI